MISVREWPGTELIEQGFLAGVKHWQSRDPSPGRQSTPGLGGVQPLAGWGVGKDMIGWQNWRHKNLGLCLHKNTVCGSLTLHTAAPELGWPTVLWQKGQK